MNCTRSSSIMIPIPKKNSYSINNNIFDPINSSPPNEFIVKLNLRHNIYDNKHQTYSEYSYEKKEKKEKNIYFTPDHLVSSSLEKK